MLLANRISLIQESPTFAVLAKASKMKKDGQDVIVLAAGEPDFDTPLHIKEAAIKAINEGKTKYTPVSGIHELKQAIVNKFAQENNLNYSIHQVLVSSGGKHSIYNALQALINDGDEVIIPAPYWVSYPDMVLLAGGKPVCIECTMQDSYKLTPQKLAAAINLKTKALILNSPSNPTGMIYSQSELAALAQVIKKHPQLIVITDDIYEHIRFTQEPFSNIVNAAPELQSRAIVINGVSKAYAMTGWRIGFAASSNVEIIKAMENIQSQSTSNPCSIAQYAAYAALTGGRECLTSMKQEFSQRHDYVMQRINQIKGLQCLKAQGAFYAFFNCLDAINNMYNLGKIAQATDLSLANYLLDNHLVACVPGSAFGVNNHMRISFATSFNELQRALDRLEKALT